MSEASKGLRVSRYRTREGGTGFIAMGPHEPTLYGTGETREDAIEDYREALAFWKEHTEHRGA